MYIIHNFNDTIDFQDDPQVDCIEHMAIYLEFLPPSCVNIRHRDQSILLLFLPIFLSVNFF